MTDSQQRAPIRRMEREELHHLVQQLRRLAAPSRELDAMIYQARCGIPEGQAQISETGHITVHFPHGGYWHRRTRERYTEVINDAAMAVPEGWGWRIENDGVAEVFTKPDRERGEDHRRPLGPYCCREEGATPALGLVIAAVRALWHEAAYGQ